MSKTPLRSILVMAALLVSFGPVFADDPSGHSSKASVAPEEALSRLTEGNKRFVSGKLEHPRQAADRRAELATGQAPFAVILGCADSRTAPEVTFDQGLGDLFVVRVAGNVINDEGLGSIEYAVEHLGTRLVVVLGHERCGAVKAARDTIAAKQEAPRHLDSLVAAIKPAVEATASADEESTAKANVANVVKALQTSEPVLKAMVEKKEVVVKGAYYDLDTGMVTFLDSK